MEKIFEPLLELSNITSSEFSTETFLEELSFKIIDTLHAEFCVVALYDKTDDQLYYHIGCWRETKLSKKSFNDQPERKKVTNAVKICAEKKIIQSFTERDISFNIKQDCEEKFNISATSVLIAPMLSSGTLIGVIEVLNKSVHKIFSEHDKNLLKIFSNYAAIAISNKQLFTEVLHKDEFSTLGQSILNSAHSLKNILNNMDGGAFIVGKGAALKDLKEVEKGWDMIKRNTNRLRELVLDILLYSRPKQPEFKPSDINQICKDIGDLLNENSKAYNVEIKLFLDKISNDFWFDPISIHRCLLNIISNAVYACGKKGGGRVNVTTKTCEDDVLEIKVSDNGIGISKENLPHIFDIFFTTKGADGTGLGLAVTKKIIDDHNGTIQVTSTVDIGTKFIITLPNNKYHR